MNGLKLICFSLCILFLSACDNPGDTFRIKLVDATVDQQRETSGDRPYFNTLFFRSTFNTPGSTSVNLRNREPHDWVSKTQYNFGTLPTGHMNAGDGLPIPWWMGEHEWRNLKMIDLVDLLEDRNIEVAGAVIVSLDNNNTPPHVVREILEDFTNIIRTLMTSHIERGEWVLLITDPTRFFDDLFVTIRTNLPVSDLAANFFQYTIGSTFNPDQPTGVEIILIPTVRGLTSPITGSVTVPGPSGDVDVIITVLPATTSTRSISFAGSNARYVVNALSELQNNSEDDVMIDEITVSIKTGADESRAGGTIDLEVRHCVGSSTRTTTYANINSSLEMAPHSDNTYSVPYTGPVGSVRGVRLLWHPSQDIFQTPDNWDVEALRLGWPSQTSTGTYFINQGHPLFRLTDSARSYSFTFDQNGCG